MTEILSSLFRDTPKSDLPILAYLMQGKLRPDYEGVELGIAEKLALRALASPARSTPGCGQPKSAAGKPNTSSLGRSPSAEP